jgi:hypothetical protein
MKNVRMTIWLMVAVIGLVTYGVTHASWQQQTRLYASPPSAWNYFGIGVGISGEYAIVGSTGGGGIDATGAAYIYKRNGQLWTMQAKLPTPYGTMADQYGKNVSISGDYTIVSAVRDGSHGSFSGAAYIFVRDGNNWLVQAKLNASDAATYDAFSYSVSISGDFALVGAWGDDDAGVDSGAGYIFMRNGSTWSQIAKLNPGSAGDRLGLAVCINGDFAIIGGRPWPESRPGCAYVFKHEGTNWVNEGKLTAPDGQAGDWFGYDRSVSVSQEFAAVGAAAVGSGAVYIFKRTATGWQFHTKLTAWDGHAGDQFGSSVSLSGRLLIVGASGDDDKASNAGSAYIFSYDATNWVPQSKLLGSDITTNYNFGYSVSIDNSYSIVGGTSYEYNVGSAYVFVKPTPGDIDTDGDIDYDDFVLFKNAFASSAGSPNYTLRADLDADGRVTFVDYQQWLALYNEANHLTGMAYAAPAVAGDLDGDQDVDFYDFAAFAASFDNSSPIAFEDLQFIALHWLECWRFDFP